MHYFITVERRSLGIVLLLNAHLRIVVRLGLEKLFSLTITAHFHLLELNVLPFVHGGRSYEAQMNAKATMLARTLQADKDAIRDAHPLRRMSIALEARLKATKL